MVTVISTFAGCGGSSLGYKMAGYKELLAIDFDKKACETFKLNFTCPIWKRDIKTVTAKEILDFCKIKKGELDVLDGSPPCQGFSTTGKRKIIDNRNDLFIEFVRLIEGLQPKVFVMENVSGMITGKMKGKFMEIILSLKSTGYQVKCKLINTMWYRVPQSRQRLIFIGIRRVLNVVPTFPEPQGRLITPREALKDCPVDDIKSLPPWLIEAVKNMIPGNYSEKPTRRAFIKAKGNFSGAFNTKLLSWDRISCTLLKSEIGCAGIIHPDGQRYLSISEMKRISSFPDSFKFSGDRKDRVSGLGNSVPPLFMKAIALHIKKNIIGAIKM